MIRQTARYNNGIPLIITVIHAGSTDNLTPILGNAKLKIRNTPPINVIGIPARISFIFFSIVHSPFIFAFLANSSMYHMISKLSNTLFIIYSMSDLMQIQWIDRANCKLLNNPLKLYENSDTKVGGTMYGQMTTKNKSSYFSQHSENCSQKRIIIRSLYRKS